MQWSRHHIQNICFSGGVIGILALVVISSLVLVRQPSHALALPPSVDATALMGNEPVGADFAVYVQSQGGTAILGHAITPELPNGAQLSQVLQSILLSDGFSSNSAVIAQPIVAQLMQQRAALPVIAGLAATYASLATRSASAAWVPAPRDEQATGSTAQAVVFVPLGIRDGVVVGHVVPPVFAAFLAQRNQWQSLLGNPLTEAISLPAQGTTPGVQIQAFMDGVLVADGGGKVGFSQAGRDWLATFGRPTMQIDPQTPVQVMQPTQVLSVPGGTVTATFTTPFAATLVGDVQWRGTTLWEHIRWRNLLQAREGWVKADSIAFESGTTSATEIADIDALSPQLAAYVAQLGDNTAIAVYVPNQHRYYEYNAQLALETASTIKIVILVTLLGQAEAQGRGLTGAEQAAAASMIIYSDNDAAQDLYDEVGGNPGLDAYMTSIGINDVGLNFNGFGATTVPPTMMITLLDALRTSAILTPGDCQYVLGLMANVADDEQMGLGDTAPDGAVVQLKDGFGEEEDGLNVVVTVGILTYQGNVYEVSVFTRREQSVQQGTAYVNTICQDIALALLGQP